MLRAVFFDMGGTLDGDGLHWLDRFVELYARAGCSISGDMARAAFAAAERAAAADTAIQDSRLHEMVDRHVGWQLQELRRLGVDLPVPSSHAGSLREQIVNGFVGPVREAAVLNQRLLASLHEKGLRLGVVSNGCGNVQTLCDDLGYSQWLSVVVDSRTVRLFKPDPDIYRHAAARIHLSPVSIMMVGDSFERDIRPARSIGMKTAWLQGAADRPCPDPSCVDVTLRRLADLPGALDSLPSGGTSMGQAAKARTVA